MTGEGDSIPADRHRYPPELSKSQLLRRLLESIAHEELALAHIVNEEAVKIGKASRCIMGPFTPDELIALQRSVSDVLDKLSTKEDILLRKLRIVLAFNQDCDTCREEE